MLLPVAGVVIFDVSKDRSNFIYHGFPARLHLFLDGLSLKTSRREELAPQGNSVTRHETRTGL